MPPSQVAEHSPHSPQGAKSHLRLGRGPQCGGVRPEANSEGIECYEDL